MEVFDILDFSIPAESTTSKIILRSSDFKDILSDIDSSSDYVEFTFSEEPQFFKILTSGIAGKCSVSQKKNIYIYTNLITGEFYFHHILYFILLFRLRYHLKVKLWNNLYVVQQ